MKRIREITDYGDGTVFVRYEDGTTARLRDLGGLRQRLLLKVAEQYEDDARAYRRALKSRKARRAS